MLHNLLTEQKLLYLENTPKHILLHEVQFYSLQKENYRSSFKHKIHRVCKNTSVQ